MTFLVTGSAGFIGFHLTKRLLMEGFSVVGFDNLNPYYDINLKKARIKELQKISKLENIPFYFVKGKLENRKELDYVFDKFNPDKVINLAAQAGVRYSIENPDVYLQTNILGFGNLLECCRFGNVNHFIYASSSSVYGGNENLPFSEKEGVDHPVSLYAATKKSNELIAHTYSHLFNLPSTGLRFFTVYGPWGRPDMALFKFTKLMIEGKEIEVFNHGQMIRDFTYIDDIVESLFRVINKIATPSKNFNKISPDPSISFAPYRVFNIGNSNPIPLMHYIDALEKTLGIKAKKKFMPIQPGDVPETAANTSLLENWIGFKPSTSVEEGIYNFVSWYRHFYKLND